MFCRHLRLWVFGTPKHCTSTRLPRSSCTNNGEEHTILSWCFIFRLCNAITLPEINDLSYAGLSLVFTSHKKWVPHYRYQVIKTILGYPAHITLRYSASRLASSLTCWISEPAAAVLDKVWLLHVTLWIMGEEGVISWHCFMGGVTKSLRGSTAVRPNCE